MANSAKDQKLLSILNNYRDGKFINTRAYVFNGDKWKLLDCNYFKSNGEYTRINGGKKLT